LSKKERRFLNAKDGMTVVCQFLGEYYWIYESDNRKLLVSAYHVNVMFSIRSTYPLNQSSTTALGKFLLQDLIISDSFKIWGLRFSQWQKFIFSLTLKMEAVCGIHLPDYMVS
jgi:hypothetical protein